MFKSDFYYLESIMLHTRWVERIVHYHSKNPLTYDLIKYSYILTNLSVKDVKYQLHTSTIGADHSSNGPYPPIMKLSKNFKSSPSAMNMSLTKIIPYLSLAHSSTWHLHIIIFFALSYVRQKSTFALFRFINFPYWVSHIVITASFCLSFDLILPITIFKLLPLLNRIRKFLRFSFPLPMFTQPCSIGQ